MTYQHRDGARAAVTSGVRDSEARAAVTSAVRAWGERLVGLSHSLHDEPETTLQEHRSAAKIAGLLSDAGSEVTGGGTTFRDLERSSLSSHVCPGGTHVTAPFPVPSPAP